MTKEEIAEVERWRAEHRVRWFFQRRVWPFLWRVVGIFYRHKSLELQCNPFFGDTWISDEHYYEYPDDFLFRYSNSVRDGKLYLKYFPRWWGVCERTLRSPENFRKK